MAEIPEDIKERLKAHLTDIARLFAAPHITLIIRGAENASGDLVFGNDNPSLALEALRKRMLAEAVQHLNGDL